MTVPLGQASLELIFRAGTPTGFNLQAAYGPDATRTDLFGLSVLFHAGWNVDQLARAGNFRHSMVSFAAVTQLRAALQLIGYDLLLTATPSRLLPAHHTLSVTRQGLILADLPADAAQALSSVLLPNTVPNPYMRP
jgi:hypothetical protein